MIKKVKMLLGLCVLGTGLTGCIVIPDDELYSSSYYSYSSYDPYPVGSYEWATDYYHRPPAPRHHHYKHHKSDYRYIKPEPKKPGHDKHHIEKPGHDKHHIEKPEHDKHHNVPKNEIKKDKPSHDVPKNRIDKKQPPRDLPKQNHGSSFDKKPNMPEHKLKSHKVFPHH